MKVMILAAGRGERMGVLTDEHPKPLLQVNGCSLIEHLLQQLIQCGFKEFVVNVAYRGEQIKYVLGTGERWRVDVVYSDEAETALETGGGIYKALPLLGDTHFAVVNADIWTDFPFDTLRDKTERKAHLVLIDNPSYNIGGDFLVSVEGYALNSNNDAGEKGESSKTFSGIGVYHPSFFVDEKPGAFPLAPIIRRSIAAEQVTAEFYQGLWVDIGTPERLAAVQTSNQ
ncbi:MAG: mannose-1-phosphate guanylyltransferase [Cycloclasticus sp. symbiont of Poecilosclerida sp. M]|nr:MAG: mannose-1-phosphate guanylyltransferase [Cycloclasticus sp. symbiont of Poecilosclerida sp. M]